VTTAVSWYWNVCILDVIGAKDDVSGDDNWSIRHAQLVRKKETN